MQPILRHGIGSLADARDVSLHIHCVGHGEPRVIFDAGLGSDGTVWSNVLPEVGRFTTACAYDGAGLGQSGPAPRPHTNRRMAEELHALLLAAGLNGPYVLVGHSMGGVNVRLFASEHPDDMAGERPRISFDSWRVSRRLCALGRAGLVAEEGLIRQQPIVAERSLVPPTTSLRCGRAPSRPLASRMAVPAPARPSSRSQRGELGIDRAFIKAVRPAN